MIIREYIKDFEKLGFGMFVHFGAYSMIEKGEWVKEIHRISDEEYLTAVKAFNPDKNWAAELVSTAKKAGCKYITLTTRHHDGFSLFDTCGLNEYDTPHTCGRDLVREFVDECNAQGIVPFFYHTLLDWWHPDFDTDFKSYLKYLRASVELLCKNYGKIGGIWFDGMWSKPDEDWEEDALYGMIRSHQPNAMIINNTGLSARGALGHIELDSVTFERGKPGAINMEGAPKYVASEMCQTMNEHWGYAANDFRYKSLESLIEDFCVCRRFGSNFLLNVGPMGNGLLRPLDKAILEEIGKWAKIHEEALYLPRPCGISETGKAKDFVLEKDGVYYLFCHNLPMVASIDVQLNEDANFNDTFPFDKKIKSITWLDTPNKEVAYTDNGDGTITVHSEAYKYGSHLVVRVAKIVTE